MGESWHDDGMLMKKKNTFYDFVDSAPVVDRRRWTNKDRLMIEGASAGGLLLGPSRTCGPICSAPVHAGVHPSWMS